MRQDQVMPQRSQTVVGGVRADQNKLIGIELTYEDYMGREELQMISTDIIFPGGADSYQRNAHIIVTFHMSNGDKQLRVQL